METNTLTLTAFQIMGSSTVLNKVANAELDLKTAILFAENIDALRIANEQIEKKRMALIEKYAKKDESGEIVTDGDSGNIVLDNSSEFIRNMDELLSTKIEVPLKPIDIDILEGVDIKFTPNDYLALKPLLKS